MFGRFSNLYKPLKKIDVDQNKFHIYLKGTNVKLVLLRPYDLVQLGALVGSGSEDILIWTGKIIGKNLCQAIQDSSKEKKREKLLGSVLETLSSMGFGRFSMSYKEGKNATIKVSDPISSAIKDKGDAKVLCDLYNGLFNGMFTATGIDVEGNEKECILKGNPNCIFEYQFEEA